MHPSRVHKSTTEAPDSGLRLGFTDINPKPGQPSGLSQETPTKTGISSPAFDFRFARPGPQLGPDAQRMMDELREEALRIKAKLAAEREEKRRVEEAADSMAGRKIAQPKGKVSRFSDVHMAAFKKMDSIEGHASSFRAQPSRLTPAKNTLKRTQSKANLDEKEETIVAPPSEKKLHAERLENTAPAKRARKHISDDTSSARPVSQDGGSTIKMVPSTPTMPRTQSNVHSSITTPTHASLARSVNAKPVTHVPASSRFPSKPPLVSTPRSMTKSATTPNLNNRPRSASKNFLRSPGRLDRVRSILRYPSSSRKAPAPPSSIPMLSKSASKADLKRPLPSIPTTPVALARTKSVKHVNFTPDAVSSHAAMVASSPSPLKSCIPRSTSKLNLSAEARASGETPTKDVLYPSLAGHPALAKFPSEVGYPSLGTPRPLPEPPRQAKTEPRPTPSVPGTFHFRSERTMNFSTPPKGFGSSPGQVSVRQVRPSIFPGNIPGSFPEGNKENAAPLPSIPHGMPNKKRRRADSDDEGENDDERSPKKQKAVAEGPMLVAPRIMASMPLTRLKTPSPTKKKGVLTLSRLNMLARPKVRK